MFEQTITIEHAELVQREAQEALVQLAEMQLACVGGGIGTVTVA